MSGAPLLDDEIRKKDEDAKIISSSMIHGTLIRTTANIGSEVEEEEETQRDMFHTVPINIRIVRHVFVVNATIVFFFIMFGIVPHHLLYDTSLTIKSIILGCSSGLGFVAFAVMYAFREEPHVALIFCSVWIVNAYIITICLGVMMHTLIFFQACLIMFIQQLSILSYSLYSKKKILPTPSVLIMLSSGMLVWGWNIYAFLKEQDWISAVVLFFVVVIGHSLYCSCEIYLTNQHRLTNNELIKAIIYYYTDPVFIPVRWMRVRFAKNPPDVSFVLVGSDPSAQTHVTQEVTI